jgi:nitrite reductase/ring-hydroxylating ferredoxin subunit
MMPTTALPDAVRPEPWLKLASHEVSEGVALHRRVVEQIFTGVGIIRGKAAEAALRANGISALHEVLDARDVSALRDRVLEALRPNLLAMAVAVGRGVLGWRDDFFVDDYLILRVNFPYEVARKADATAENPGIGRVSPWMREAARARRVIDPVFDPRSYHKGHPPAAWAHGPHLDSWAGHSKDGRNIWWAIGEVPREAGMILYPELAGADLPVDPRSLYLQSGYSLPKPTYLPLDAGEMLVFDPEILHGTHLNLTDKTRVAVSLRLNVRQPTFDPNCFYAREFWRQASDIEAGRYSVVHHFKREQHLAAAAPPSTAPRPPRTAILTVEPPAGQGSLEVGAASLVSEGGRLAVQVAGRTVVILRRNGQLMAFDAACPHYGISLADGAADDTTMFCPGCGVGFDLASGCSASQSLTLRQLAVGERDGTILLDLGAVAGSRAASRCLPGN